MDRFGLVGCDDDEACFLLKGSAAEQTLMKLTRRMTQAVRLAFDVTVHPRWMEFELAKIISLRCHLPLTQNC